MRVVLTGARVGRILAASGLACGAGLLAPAAASAHGLVAREDLPIPDWLFTWGAAVVLIVSFVALSVLWHNTRFETDSWRPAPGWLSRLLVNRVTEAAAGVVGVILLGVTVWSGLYGTEAPDRNFAVTFVFVTFWLGLVLLSVLFGDVYRALNPWRAIGRAVGGIFNLVAGQAAPAPLRYPERLGVWPAVLGLAGFAWLELVYAFSGFQSVGLSGHTVAVATLIYSAVTFVGMALYGVEEWTRKGEAFSVYFRMFAGMSALDVRERRLGFRRSLSGLTDWAAPAGSVAFVLLAIGATAYDGASEGFLLEPTRWLFDRFSDLGLGPVAAFRVAGTIFIAVTVGVVAGLFFGGIRGMRSVRPDLTVRELSRLFAHAFVPIALAYVTAHYFSLFVFQEQAQFAYLLSDPLGDGSDLFGTASGGVDYALIGAETLWYVQVGSLVVGHVLALVLGHDRALRVYGDNATASRSQYWMLAMMVAFTTLGLFLLSQANG